MSDPVADALEQAHQAGVTLDEAQLEWLERMRREHGEEVQFELWTMPEGGAVTDSMPPRPEDLFPGRSVFAFSYQTPLSYLPEPEHHSFAIPDPGEPYETPDGGR